MYMELDQFGVCVPFDFHFDRSDVVVRAKRPGVRGLHAVETVNLHYSLVGGQQLLIQRLNFKDLKITARSSGCEVARAKEVRFSDFDLG